MKREELNWIDADEEQADAIFELITEAERMGEPTPEETLHEIDSILGWCGVEGFSTTTDPEDVFAPWFLYVNNGHMYQATIAFDPLKDEFVCSSWGDIVEAENERLRSC